MQTTERFEAVPRRYLTNEYALLHSLADAQYEVAHYQSKALAARGRLRAAMGRLDGRHVTSAGVPMDLPPTISAGRNAYDRAYYRERGWDGWGNRTMRKVQHRAEVQAEIRRFTRDGYPATGFGPFLGSL